MAYCPDYSDSDSCFSDDNDYYEFKKRIKTNNLQRYAQTEAKTEEEKFKEKLKSLFRALSSGNIQQVVSHIDSGIDVNIKIQDGWTPLLLAASFGNYDLTKVLLEKGANVNLNREDITPLMMACNCPQTTSSFEKSFEVIKLLVNNNVNVKAINRKRITAFMYAAYVGNLEAVKYLLPLSDKNAKDNQNWTALFWAVSGNSVEVVKYLLNEGFEYNLADVRTDTPVQIAKNNDFYEIIELFPKDEEDAILYLLDCYNCQFEDNFSNLKERPKFFLEICNILYALNNESVIENVVIENVGLYDFLSASIDDLKGLKVDMPFQRARILGGLHRFHKQPFQTKSLHHVPLSEPYSNMDIGIQINCIVIQILAMEASLMYILKNRKDQNTFHIHKREIIRNIQMINTKINMCTSLVSKLISIAKNLGSATLDRFLVFHAEVRSKGR